MNLHWALVLPLALAATACATPAGKLTDADFETRAITFDEQPAVIVANLYDSLRSCPQHGVVECAPQRPDGSTQCDVYSQSGLPGVPRSDLVIGRFRVLPGERAGSRLIIQAANWTGRRSSRLANWERMASTGACN